MIEILSQSPVLKAIDHYVETESDESIAKVRSLLSTTQSVNEPADLPPLVFTVQIQSERRKKAYPELVRLLIERGANVNAVISFHQRPPLFSASMYGHIEVAKILIEARADLERRDAFLQMTPLEVSLQFQKFQVSELLLENGAQANEANSMTGMAPIFIAVEQLHRAQPIDGKKTLKSLIEKGLNPSSRNQKTNESLRDYCLRIGATELAKLSMN